MLNSRTLLVIHFKYSTLYPNSLSISFPYSPLPAEVHSLILKKKKKKIQLNFLNCWIVYGMRTLTLFCKPQSNFARHAQLTSGYSREGKVVGDMQPLWVAFSGLRLVNCHLVTRLCPFSGTLTQCPLIAWLLGETGHTSTTLLSMADVSVLLLLTGDL